MKSKEATLTPSVTKNISGIQRSHLRLIAAVLEQPEEIVLAFLLAKRQILTDSDSVSSQS